MASQAVTPRVSVVMPVFNGGPLLAEALDSLCQQTLPAFECVIVDDGSTDESLALCQDMVGNDDRFRVLTQPHAGIVAALNWGVSVAQAPLIARMDADDICRSDRLEKQVAYLNAHPEIGVLATTVSFVGDAELNKGFHLFVEWNNSLLTHQAMALNRFVESPVVHPSVCFRREVFDRFGPYRDHGLPEDYALWLNMFAGGVRFAKINAPLVAWRDRPHRLSRRDERCSPMAFARCKAAYLAQWLRDHGRQRPVWVWGAGRTSRQRAACLQEHGVAYAAYVDIDPRKVGQRINGLPVLAPDDLPAPGAAIVLSYVGNRGARPLIRQALSGRGYREGFDFWMAA